MCRYCDYNLSLHYLINNTNLLEESITEFNEDVDSISEDKKIKLSLIESATSKYQISNDIFTNNFNIATEPQPEIDDFPVIEVSTTEETTSTFQVPDTAFSSLPAGDVHSRFLRHEFHADAGVALGVRLPVRGRLDSDCCDRTTSLLQA